MRKRFILAMMALAVIGLLVGGFTAYETVDARASAQAVSDTAPVMDFFDHNDVLIMNPKKRGTSDLVRTVDGASVNIDTVDLPVGATSIWWIIFNNPSGCSDGECGMNDVLPPPGTAEAAVSVAWATGGIVGPDRMGHFSASLGIGAEAAPGQLLWGDGLTNPFGAEIHIEVRYHGPAEWDNPPLLHAQMTNVGGNCTPESFGTDPNGFSCYGSQATVHKP